MGNFAPLITLNNGVRMPALGLGLFLAPAAQTVTCIEIAIGAGYRLFDTASAYLNERAVAKASGSAASTGPSCSLPARCGSRSSAMTRRSLHSSRAANALGSTTRPVPAALALAVNSTRRRILSPRLNGYSAAAEFARLASAISCRNTCAHCSAGATSCRRSTRSNCTPISFKPKPARRQRPARYRDAVLGAHRRHLQSQAQSYPLQRNIPAGAPP